MSLGRDEHGRQMYAMMKEMHGSMLKQAMAPKKSRKKSQKMHLNKKRRLQARKVLTGSLIQPEYSKR